MWRGVRWKVAGCSSSRGPEVVPRGKWKEVNKSDLVAFVLQHLAWNGRQWLCRERLE